jgi:hypothetical protein
VANGARTTDSHVQYALARSAQEHSHGVACVTRRQPLGQRTRDPRDPRRAFGAGEGGESLPGAGTGARKHRARTVRSAAAAADHGDAFATTCSRGNARSQRRDERGRRCRRTRGCCARPANFRTSRSSSRTPRERTGSDVCDAGRHHALGHARGALRDRRGRALEGAPGRCHRDASPRRGGARTPRQLAGYCRGQRLGARRAAASSGSRHTRGASTSPPAAR